MPFAPHLQATPTMPSSTPADVIDALTKRTQDGGTEVVEAKAGKVRAHVEVMGCAAHMPEHHTCLNSTHA